MGIFSRHGGGGALLVLFVQRLFWKQGPPRREKSWATWKEFERREEAVDLHASAQGKKKIKIVFAVHIEGRWRENSFQESKSGRRAWPKCKGMRMGETGKFDATFLLGGVQITPNAGAGRQKTQKAWGRGKGKRRLSMANELVS